MGYFDQFYLEIYVSNSSEAKVEDELTRRFLTCSGQKLKMEEYVCVRIRIEVSSTSS